MCTKSVHSSNALSHVRQFSADFVDAFIHKWGIADCDSRYTESFVKRVAWDAVEGRRGSRSGVTPK